MWRDLTQVAAEPGLGCIAARLGQVVFGCIAGWAPHGMTLVAPPIQGSGPLMQFSARVGRSRACVRVQASRLEWSLIGRQWIIQMAPLTSIIAVTAEPGHSKSRLLVTTAVGTADFHMKPETAEQARMLLTRLIAAANAEPERLTSAHENALEAGDDDLINLRWKFAAAVVDPTALDEEPRRLLGF